MVRTAGIDIQDFGKVVKRWYDGFRFGNQDCIYKPWSVINFLSENQLHAYWANTSSNSLVSSLVQNGNVELMLLA